MYKIEHYSELSGNPLSAEGKERWDAFAAKSREGTLFHTQRFLSYHESHHLLDSYIISEGGKVLCVIAGMIKDNSFVSPVHSSYGGFVFGQKAGIKEKVEIISSFEEYLKEKGITEVKLVPPPGMYCGSFEQESVLYLLGYEIYRQDILNITNLAEYNTEKLSNPVKRNIRRCGEKGIEDRPAADYEEFYKILCENRAAKNVQPVHSLQDLKKLNKLVGKDMALLGAYKGSEMIAGVLLFILNNDAALNFYLCHKAGHEGLRVNDMLIDYSLHYARGRGCRLYDFGTSSFDRDVNWGLMRFKEKFAPITGIRKYYRKSL